MKAAERRQRVVEEQIVPEIEVLLRVALTLTRNHADAEDLVQETLLRAYKAIDRFDGRHPRAWLVKIMRNAHLNAIRKKAPVLARDDDRWQDLLAANPDPAAGPEEIAVGSAIDPGVAAAYRSLPEEFRKVVELVDIQGLSYRETAETLGIKIGTVMSRLHRARSRMKDQLLAEGSVRK